MKKIIFGIIVVVIVMISVFVYLENSKKNNSYSTPEVALSNVENPKLDVLEIFDTKFYDNVAYVFYYSEVGETPKDYLAAGKIIKNKYGWRFNEIIGVGSIDKNNVGMSSGKDDYIVGLASKEVTKVKFGNHEANMITMDEKEMKAFLFHGVEPDLTAQTDFEYFDKEGSELPY
ncbi:hypothetical protein [Oceanobacillus salinisoli]|uniref:hypothetical protein n=1 Tax=Oceanobacillus salinisoli TaxID=2678611 RepID=UPI0012E14BBA|nr:hypothetical protein [Oceanobacillus salinisoli]